MWQARESGVGGADGHTRGPGDWVCGQFGDGQMMNGWAGVQVDVPSVRPMTVVLELTALFDLTAL